MSRNAIAACAAVTMTVAVTIIVVGVIELDARMKARNWERVLEARKAAVEAAGRAADDRLLACLGAAAPPPPEAGEKSARRWLSLTAVECLTRAAETGDPDADTLGALRRELHDTVADDSDRRTNDALKRVYRFAAWRAPTESTPAGGNGR